MARSRKSKHKIAVRMCAGCCCRFDRRKVLQTLVDAFAESCEFEYMYEKDLEKNYDLMRLVLHTLKDYPRELRDSLGARLFALLVDINRQFYQIALLPDDNKDKITLIDQMKAQFDEALFLVRVSHDLQACGSKRAIQLTEHIISITNQLNAWRESFIKEIVEAAPTQSS